MGMPYSNAALNTNETRNRNLAAVFEAIRNAPGQSRSEIGAEMPFSLQTMTNVVQELLDIGLVEEFDRGGARGRGNQHRELHIAADRCYALGVQFRWNSCSFALINLDFGVVDTAVCMIDAPFSDADDYLRKLEAHIEAFISTHAGKDIWAIGLSGPLPIEVPNPPPHDISFDDFRLDQNWFRHFFGQVNIKSIHRRFEERFDLPVLVLNNVQSAAIAEANALPLNRRFVYLLAGLSLAASFVVQRGLSPDTWPHGGELGHVIYRDRTIAAVLSAGGVRMRLGINAAQGELEAKLQTMLREDPAAFDPWLNEAAPILRFLVNFVENALWPDGIALAGFLPDALLDRLIVAAHPLPDSVVLPNGDARRTMPRLYRAKSGSDRIPVGAAMAVLSSRSNSEFPALIAAHRRSA